MIRVQLWVLFLPIFCLSELITVETSRGAVQGFDQDFGNDRTQRYYGYGQVFLGIPFAKPPVGDRRFSLPEDICQYNDRGEVHNATYYRPRCMQKTKSAGVDEDCLYLNVITPNITGSYPVMVYIPGGTFTTGGAEKYHWKGAIRNLVSRGVVVVTIQYRVSMFGFFTTFTEQFPPNRGLYDQILALRWVNNEIANFGGDSSRITLFGNSAGASSVSDLSLSPLARGLFHQIIQESGSAMIQLETIDNPNGSIHQLRAMQVCGINSTDWGSAEKDQELLDCLMQADPKDLVANDFSFNKRWAVAVDGALLPDIPEKLAEYRPKYPTLMGDMLEEFALYLQGVAEGDVSQIDSQTNRYILDLNEPYLDDATAANFSDTMINGYANGVIPDDDDHLGWAKLTTDTITGFAFSSMMIRDAQWHRKYGNKNVWLFTFALRSMLPFGVEIDDWIPVAHEAELPYLWFYPNVWETYNATDADFAVADFLGKMWTDFAKKGKLSLPRAQKNMKYVEIGEVPSLKKNWRQTADVVYNQQIPSYLGEFPDLSISDESWATMQLLGETVVAKWNSKTCPNIATHSTPTTTI